MTVIRLRQPDLDFEAQMSDDAIALACMSGDPSAIGALFSRHERTVTGFVGRLVPHDDIEDLVQATFLEVIRGEARYAGRVSVHHWLLGVAAATVKRHLVARARRRRLARCLSLIGGGEHERMAPRLEARQTLERAEQILARLDVDKRLAFVMCELEGLSAREAAELLGTSETAIWKRVSDARKSLRAAAKEGSR